jgi:Caspase domain
LVIGINVYASPELKNLTAAAEDADKFEKFLLDDLDVPPSHIISLRNEKATRAAIIDAFINLRDDARIVRADDPAIIIYFAGHGARVDKPKEWKDWESNTGHIEMLAPTDISMMRVTDSGEEKLVDGIPDRTISVLLNHLSDVRGDNVVSSDANICIGYPI